MDEKKSCVKIIVGPNSMKFHSRRSDGSAFGKKNCRSLGSIFQRKYHLYIVFLVIFIYFAIIYLLKKSKKIRGPFLNPQPNDNNLSHPKKKN